MFLFPFGFIFFFIRLFVCWSIVSSAITTTTKTKTNTQTDWTHLYVLVLTFFYHCNKNREHRCSTNVYVLRRLNDQCNWSPWILFLFLSLSFLSLCLSLFLAASLRLDCEYKTSTDHCWSTHHFARLVEILILDIKCSFISIGDFSSTSSHSQNPLPFCHRANPLNVWIVCTNNGKENEEIDLNGIDGLWP